MNFLKKLADRGKSPSVRPEPEPSQARRNSRTDSPQEPRRYSDSLSEADAGARSGERKFSVGDGAPPRRAEKSSASQADVLHAFPLSAADRTEYRSEIFGQAVSRMTRVWSNFLLWQKESSQSSPGVQQQAGQLVTTVPKHRAMSPSKVKPEPDQKNPNALLVLTLAGMKDVLPTTSDWRGNETRHPNYFARYREVALAALSELEHMRALDGGPRLDLTLLLAEIRNLAEKMSSEDTKAHLYALAQAIRQYRNQLEPLIQEGERLLASAFLDQKNHAKGHSFFGNWLRNVDEIVRANYLTLERYGTELIAIDVLAELHNRNPAAVEGLLESFSAEDLEKILDARPTELMEGDARYAFLVAVTKALHLIPQAPQPAAISAKPAENPIVRAFREKADIYAAALEAGGSAEGIASDAMSWLQSVPPDEIARLSKAERDTLDRLSGVLDITNFMKATLTPAMPSSENAARYSSPHREKQEAGPFRATPKKEPRPATDFAKRSDLPSPPKFKGS